MEHDGLSKEVEKLKHRMDLLEQRRVSQTSVLPQAITNRAMGEPNTYVFSGLSANRPAEGFQLSTTGYGCSIYWSYDTGILSIWQPAIGSNPAGWLEVTLA